MSQASLAEPLKRASPGAADDQPPEKRRKDSAAEQSGSMQKKEAAGQPTRSASEHGRGNLSQGGPGDRSAARGERPRELKDHPAKAGSESREREPSVSRQGAEAEIEHRQPVTETKGADVSGGPSSAGGASLRPVAAGAASAAGDAEWCYEGRSKKMSGPYPLDMLMDGLENGKLWPHLMVYKKKRDGFWPPVRLQDLLEGNVDLEAMEERRSPGDEKAGGGVSELRGEKASGEDSQGPQDRKPVATAGSTGSAGSFRSGEITRARPRKEGGGMGQNGQAREERSQGLQAKSQTGVGLGGTTEATGPSTRKSGEDGAAPTTEGAERRDKVRVDFRKLGLGVRKAPLLRAFKTEDEPGAPSANEKDPWRQPELDKGKRVRGTEHGRESSGSGLQSSGANLGASSKKETLRGGFPPKVTEKGGDAKAEQLSQGGNQQPESSPPARWPTVASKEGPRVSTAKPVPKSTADVTPSSQAKPAAQASAPKGDTPVKLPVSVQKASTVDLGSPPGHLAHLQQEAAAFAAARAAQAPTHLPPGAHAQNPAQGGAWGVSPQAVPQGWLAPQQGWQGAQPQYPRPQLQWPVHGGPASQALRPAWGAFPQPGPPRSAAPQWVAETSQQPGGAAGLQPHTGGLTREQVNAGLLKPHSFVIDTEDRASELVGASCRRNCR